MDGLLKKLASRAFHSARPGICMDVAAWAAQHNCPRKHLFPPVIGEVESHIRDDAIALEEFSKHRAVLERPQTLVTIERAVIRDVVGFVELPDGQICHEGNWWLPYLQDNPAYKRRFALKRRKLKGDIYSLLCFWAPEFYHWFHDVLPRLETALPYLPSDTKFLINEKPKTWQLDSLAAYGIGPDRLEIQPAGVHTTVERLWFATPVGHTSFGSGVILRRMAARLLCHFEIARTGTQHSRIYISRRKAKLRRMSNEAEVEPILRESGFDIVISEDLSLKEQVRLFARSNTVVGPHGGGLTNIIYCPMNSRIGEIFTHADGGFGIHYLVVARQLGFTFDRFEAKPVRTSNMENDMEVNLSAFPEWLAASFPRKCEK